MSLVMLKIIRTHYSSQEARKVIHFLSTLGNGSDNSVFMIRISVRRGKRKWRGP